MEEGSLLHKALNRRHNDDDSGGIRRLENALLMDVYLLMDDEKKNDDALHHQQLLLSRLARLGVSLNEHFQRSNDDYPWMSGGDGPVFGVHCSSNGSSIPHLRAVCHYGACVADEWHAIGLLMEYDNEHSNDDNDDIAVSCWDVDDGQVLLIESAEHLPDWVDNDDDNNGDGDQVEKCRHQCWIRNHQVHLIPPLPDNNNKNNNSNETAVAASCLSLPAALDRLRANKTIVIPAVQQAIRDAVNRHRHQQQANSRQYHYHRAAVALPRSVARLLQRRPDLVATACQLFVEQSTLHTNDNNNKQQQDYYLAGTCEDWVWSTVRFGRTAYAMLRTVVAAPDWKTEDAIPAALLLLNSSSSSSSIEVKRLKRQCAVEATPHLKHALQLGVRLVAGLDYGLRKKCTTTRQQQQQQQQQQQDQPLLSFTERHVLLHWSRIVAECGGCDDDDWITKAWQAGPNHAEHCLDDILKCPVFDPEVQDSLTPLSHPATTLSEQIRKELVRHHDGDDNDNDDFGTIPPRSDQVDDEEWMWMSDRDDDDDELLPHHRQQAAKSSTTTTSTQNNNTKGLPPMTTDPTTTAGLDSMLSGVQTFMAGQSSVEGVATKTNTTGDDDEVGIQIINPTVFLNVLHTALQAKSAEELSSRLRATAATLASAEEDDPFFSKEDYDLMEPDDTSDDDDDDDERADNGNPDNSRQPDMVDFMNAMDDELNSSSASRGAMMTDDHGIIIDDKNNNDRVAQDAHVLSNLLKSLEAGAGGPGPIKNILNEVATAAATDLDKE